MSVKNASLLAVIVFSGFWLTGCGPEPAPDLPPGTKIEDTANQGVVTDQKPKAKK